VYGRLILATAGLFVIHWRRASAHRWGRELRRAVDITECRHASSRRSGNCTSQLAVDGFAPAQQPTFLRWKSHQQPVGRVGRSLRWSQVR